METQHFFHNKFLVIAHRGASFDAPENTMAAFRLAKKQGADMIELDVQLSRDGVPVVFHDDRLDKKSTGAGKVEDLRLAELKQLDAGSWFSLQFKNERIPTLQEVLEWSKNKILVNIEIKSQHMPKKNSQGIEEKIAELIERTEMKENVIISSFDYNAVLRSKQLMPEVFTGLLLNERYKTNETAGALVKRYHADFFHCSKRELNKSRAALLQNAGIPFLIYTVNSSSSMKKFIQRGAFGIFTDKPGLLRSIIDHWPG